MLATRVNGEVGTAAAHDACLVDGDVMTTTVEGLGVVVNRVVGTPS